MPTNQLSFEQLEPRQLLSATGTGSISGFVFQDGDAVLASPASPSSELAESELSDQRDGRLTSDDTPISGAVVELRAEESSAAEEGRDARRRIYPLVTKTAITDERGHFKFDGLPAGIYSLIERQPRGFADGIDTPGTGGGRSVEAHDEATLPAAQAPDGASRDAIIGIELGLGEHAAENNFSEIAVDVVLPALPTCCGSPPSSASDSDAPSANARTNVVDQSSPSTLYAAASHAPRQRDFIAGVRMPEWRWQLAIIDVSPLSNEVVESRPTPVFQSANAAMPNLRGLRFDSGQWSVTDVHGQTWRQRFGLSDSTPITGDFDGDGITEMGVYVAGQWFIDLNGNGVWDEHDFWARLGSAADLPIVGDWDGDGKDDIGVFGPNLEGHSPAAGLAVAGQAGLNQSSIRLVAEQSSSLAAGTRKGHAPLTRPTAPKPLATTSAANFGDSKDVPVTGDWNGDGKSELGVFRRGKWYLDVDGDGRFSKKDVVAEFGAPQDAPIVGDWDGNGVDDIGVFRDGMFYLDSNANREIDAADRLFAAGGAGDQPVAGDWDGDGKDEAGLFRAIEPARIARSVRPE